METSTFFKVRTPALTTGQYNQFTFFKKMTVLFSNHKYLSKQMGTKRVGKGFCGSLRVPLILTFTIYEGDINSHFESVFLLTMTF